MTTKAELSAQVSVAAMRITELQRQLQHATWALEGEQVRWTQLATECNAIYGMLDELFGFKVYAASGGDRHSEPEWLIEDKATSAVLVERCKPLAAAYYEAIMQRLEAKS